MALMASYHDSRMTQHRIKNIAYYLRNFGLDAIRRPFLYFVPLSTKEYRFFSLKVLVTIKNLATLGRSDRLLLSYASLKYVRVISHTTNDNCFLEASI